MLAANSAVEYNPTMNENEGSAQSRIQEESLEIFNIESALTDPFVERVLDQARTYNKIFEENTPTKEEQAEIIHELDTAWGTIKGSQIGFSGVVTTLNTEKEKQQIFLDGVDLVSNGFCVITEPRYVGGEYVGDLSVVKHHLYVPLIIAHGIEADEEGNTHAAATAEIDNSIIELDTASAERALAWLTTSCPDLIDEIDARILNGKGGEDDAMLSLRGLDFNEYADLSDVFTRNCLDVYLNEIIQVDNQAPYDTKLDGFIRKNDEESILYSVSADRALIYASRISMQHKFDNENDENKWVPAINIAILPTERGEEIEQFVAPFDTFKEMKSLRSAYYQVDA